MIINYGRHFIDDNDLKSVLNSLKSNKITQGPETISFENDLKKYFKSKFCSVVSSGTAALHLVGKALNWKKGDIVLLPAVTFLATANCVEYSNATVCLVDINKNKNTIDVDEVEKKIRKYRKKVKAIIGVDYAGYPCDWFKLKKIAKKNKIVLINDNCHAMGTAIKGDKGYALKYADIITHSYHPVKSFTTGEGGAILTNNKIIDTKIKILRNHGIVNRKKSEKLKPWLYQMKYLGFNYRMSDINAALGRSQLKKIDKFVRRRNKIAKIYDKNFQKLKFFQIPPKNKDILSSYHLYSLKIQFKKLKKDKKNFFIYLKKNLINVQVHYIPIYKQPYYKNKYKFKYVDYPNSEILYQNEVSIPIYYSLKEKDITYILKKIFQYFSRCK
mgnify:FL=1